MVLRAIKSYLEDRRQLVSVGGALSQEVAVHFRWSQVESGCCVGGVLRGEEGEAACVVPLYFKM